MSIRLFGSGLLATLRRVGVVFAFVSSGRVSFLAQFAKNECDGDWRRRALEELTDIVIP